MQRQGELVRKLMALECDGNEAADEHRDALNLALEEKACLADELDALRMLCEDLQHQRDAAAAARDLAIAEITVLREDANHLLLSSRGTISRHRPCPDHHHDAHGAVDDDGVAAAGIGQGEVTPREIDHHGGPHLSGTAIEEAEGRRDDHSHSSHAAAVDVDDATSALLSPWVVLYADHSDSAPCGNQQRAGSSAVMANGALNDRIVEAVDVTLLQPGCRKCLLCAAVTVLAPAEGAWLDSAMVLDHYAEVVMFAMQATSQAAVRHAEDCFSATSSHGREFGRELGDHHSDLPPIAAIDPGSSGGPLQARNANCDTGSNSLGAAAGGVPSSTPSSYSPPMMNGSSAARLGSTTARPPARVDEGVMTSPLAVNPRGVAGGGEEPAAEAMRLSQRLRKSSSVGGGAGDERPFASPPEYVTRRSVSVASETSSNRSSGRRRRVRTMDF
mgnify:CR=1 FL=1